MQRSTIFSQLRPQKPSNKTWQISLKLKRTMINWPKVQKSQKYPRLANKQKQS